jgi:long-chain acyl-CoA synthetase
MPHASLRETPATGSGRWGTSSFRSVADLWHHRIESTPDADAMTCLRDGRWVTESWSRCGDRVRAIANGLLAAGIGPEDRVCLWSETRFEWVITDLGILCSGGATTTIYPSSPDEDARFIMDHCEAVIVFCDTDARARKLLTLRDQIPRVRRVVTFDGHGGGDGWIVSLRDFEQEGRDFAERNPLAYDETRRAITPDRLATLIYTSGTTGVPKGVMLTHDSWVYEAEAVDALGLVTPADVHYLYLPLSHVFAKVLQIVFIRLGIPTVIDGDTDHLLAHLHETRPHFMGAVPRMFEKALARIHTQMRDSGRLKHGALEWAMKVGTEVSRVRQARRALGPLLRVQYKLADRLLFSKVRKRFGGRVRFMISGGAPLSREIAQFFHACDILVLEGYGLTESAAASCVNTPDDFVFGSVGRPLPGTQIRIAEDGEILLKGRGVMRGYFKQPEETAAVLSADGWLHTGDIGTLLETGHLVITDRKKEIIITAGGKNIAPAHFQGLLKSNCPFVSEVVMHGDRRPFCTALVTVNEEATGAWARARGIVFENYAELAGRPEVRTLIEGHIQAVNRTLAPFEQVKAFAIPPEDFSQENGTLTPSLKVKRKVVEQRWKHLLDQFYPEPPPRS